MGGVGDFFFGSPSKQSSTSTSSSYSDNQAYGALANAFSPALNYVTQGGSMLGSILGLNNYNPAPVGGGGNIPRAPSPSTSSLNPLTYPINSNNFRQVRQPGGPRLIEGGLNNDLGLPPGGYRGGPRINPGGGAGSGGGGSVGVPTPVGHPVPVGEGGTGTGAGGGTNPQQSALDTLSNSTGMQFIRDQGVKSIEASQAGRGMLQSGATGKALQTFGQQLGSTYLNQMLDRLIDYSKLGISAGGVMAAAGGRSASSGTGESSGKGGKNGLIPGILEAAASAPKVSDIRLKTNIVRMGETSEGIPVYEFDFIDDKRLPTGRQRGVMAHEVKRIKPEAFVPNILPGFNGVDYNKIGDL